MPARAAELTSANVVEATAIEVNAQSCSERHVEASFSAELDDGDRLVGKVAIPLRYVGGDY